MPAERPTSNGVYAGLVRPRPPRDPVSAGLLAKVAGDLRAVIAFATRAVVESRILDAETPSPPAPVVPPADVADVAWGEESP